MNTDYTAPDIDTSLAQRRAAEAQESFVNFTSIRQTQGSADASFAFGTRATRPASGVLGDRYYANDIGSVGGWLYYWNGVAWEILVGWASGSDAVRAAITVTAVDNGAWFHTTDTDKLWEVSGGAWVDRYDTIDVTTSYEVAGTKVVGARETGWSVGTGTANKGAFATYTGQDVSAAYVEAEAQATDDAVKANSQRIKAIEDMLRAHGLMN